MQRKTFPAQERTIPKTRRNKTAAAAAPAATDPQGSALNNEIPAVSQGSELSVTEASDTGRAQASPGLAQPATTTAETHPAPSKLDRLIDLLRRLEGATLPEMCAATGWQVHSVRGAMAGSLKRKGHAILSDKQDGARRYRIGAAS